MGIIDDINKKFGKDTMRKLGDPSSFKYETLSTGSIGLDRALGIGGCPRGRIIELYGPESSGKTTLTLQLIRSAQKAGLVCAFIDAEHALDISYAASLGVNVEDLLVCQPDYGEQALEITNMLCESGEVGLVVVDSVAALTPKSELEGEVGDYHVGTMARMMSQTLRMMKGKANKTKTMVCFINQIRMKIGVKFGSPETTTGGNALKYYASIRLDMRRIGSVKDGEVHTANRTRVTVRKNKCAPPFTTAEFDIGYGTGVDLIGECVEYGVSLGVINKAGAWLNWGEHKWQGRNNAINALKEDPVLADELETEVRAKLKDTTALADVVTKAKAKKTKKKPKKEQGESAEDAVKKLLKK